MPFGRLKLVPREDLVGVVGSVERVLGSEGEAPVEEGGGEEEEIGGRCGWRRRWRKELG